MTVQLPTISIIVPTFNEAANIAGLLQYLKENSSAANIEEILVVDGGSTDGTFDIVKGLGAIALKSEKGRAKQMNFGAQRANGQILYFLHADTFPPQNFDRMLLKAMKQGFPAGCFRMKFDSKSPMLGLFASFTSLKHPICRGGDQSLFITKSLFHETGAFNEAYIIFEDNEFIGRLYKKTQFKVLPQKVVTSARKYEKYGTLRLQYHFGVIHLKNFLGAGPEQLFEYYNKKIAL